VEDGWELADLKVREMELVHAIVELEQEAAAAEDIRGSNRPESEASNLTWTRNERYHHLR
jgi:hypothetical protein